MHPLRCLRLITELESPELGRGRRDRERLQLRLFSILHFNANFAFTGTSSCFLGAVSVTGCCQVTCRLTETSPVAFCHFQALLQGQLITSSTEAVSQLSLPPPLLLPGLPLQDSLQGLALALPPLGPLQAPVVDHGVDPVDKVGDAGVDAELALAAAALAEGGDAEDGPLAVLLAEERAAGVAGAGVDAAGGEAGAEHVGRDEVVLVDVVAL